MLIFIKVSHQLNYQTQMVKIILHQPVWPIGPMRHCKLPGFLQLVQLEGIPPVGNDFHHFIMVFYMFRSHMAEEILSVRQLPFAKVTLVLNNLTAKIEIFIIIGSSIFVNVTFVRWFMTKLVTYRCIWTMLFIGEILANSKLSLMHVCLFNLHSSTKV